MGRLNPPRASEYAPSLVGRRPLAVARVVIFAQFVNDPAHQQGGGFKYVNNRKKTALKRKRLFKIIEDPALWENTIVE